MSRLPHPNPISLGLMPKGWPVDHLQTFTQYCFLCDTQTEQHLFKVIADNYAGFGVPWFFKPFTQRSSTRGKTGQRQHYRVCTACGTSWAADHISQQLILESGQLGTNHALVGALGFPTDSNWQRFCQRVDAELRRQHPQVWRDGNPETAGQTEPALGAAASPSESAASNTTPASALPPPPPRDINPDHTSANQSARPEDPDVPAHKAQPQSWMSELRELGILRDRGLLTSDEFEAEKARLLANRRDA